MHLSRRPAWPSGCGGGGGGGELDFGPGFNAHLCSLAGFVFDSHEFNSSTLLCK